MEKTKKSSLMSKRVFQKYIFLSVLLIVPVANWLLFWFTVNIQSILLAFQDNRTGAFTWWNFQYFWQELTSVDGEIGLAVVNTLKYFFSNLLIVIPLSMIIAFFIYKKIWGYKTFTIIFYLPSIISSVAMVQIYMQMLASGGPIDKLFGGILNIPVEGFFSRPDTATTMIVLYTIWTGFSSNILLFVGAMTRIPIEVFEAAKLEGCKPGREFISIVFPLIWPTISTMLILSLIHI